MYGVLKLQDYLQEDLGINFTYIVCKLDPNGNGTKCCEQYSIMDWIIPYGDSKYALCPVYESSIRLENYVTGCSKKQRLENVIAGFSSIDDAAEFCKKLNKEKCEIECKYTVSIIDPKTCTLCTEKYTFKTYDGLSEKMYSMMGRRVAGFKEEVTKIGENEEKEDNTDGTDCEY